MANGVARAHNSSEAYLITVVALGTQFLTEIGPNPVDWATVLSNRYAIEHAVPRFVRALDGDAATDPNS